MGIEKMTSKQLAKEIISKKVANKMNEEFIKAGLEELRQRGVNDIVCKNGMIYTVEASTRKKVNENFINEFLKEFNKQLDDFKENIEVPAHYCVKPTNN